LVLTLVIRLALAVGRLGSTARAPRAAARASGRLLSLDVGALLRARLVVTVRTVCGCVGASRALTVHGAAYTAAATTSATLGGSRAALLLVARVVARLVLRLDLVMSIGRVSTVLGPGLADRGVEHLVRLLLGLVVEDGDDRLRGARRSGHTATTGTGLGRVRSLEEERSHGQARLGGRCLLDLVRDCLDLRCHRGGLGLHGRLGAARLRRPTRTSCWLPGLLVRTGVDL